MNTDTPSLTTTNDKPIDAGVALATLITDDTQTNWYDAGIWQMVDALFEQYQTIGRIMATPVPELATIIPFHAANRIHAAHNLILHQLLEEGIKQPQLKSPDAVGSYLCARYGAASQEQMGVLALDTRHHLVRDTVVYRGTVSTLQPRAAELFRPAIIHNTPQLILWHSHPSGDPSPSAEDQASNEVFLEAATALGIGLLDHVVIAGNNYISMKDEQIGGFI